MSFESFQKGFGNLQTEVFENRKKICRFGWNCWETFAEVSELI